MLLNVSSSSSDSGANDREAGRVRRNDRSRILPATTATLRNVANSDNRREDETTDPSIIDFGELSTDGYSLPDSVELVGAEQQCSDGQSASDSKYNPRWRGGARRNRRGQMRKARGSISSRGRGQRSIRNDNSGRQQENKEFILDADGLP